MEAIRLCSRVVLFLIFLYSSGLSRWCRADIDEVQFRKDLQAIGSIPRRVVGSDGYYETGRYLQTQIQTLPGVQLQKHEYPVMVPISQPARLILPEPSVKPVPVYPFWPAGVRPNATPADGIHGNIIYIGEARAEQIPPRALHGQIAAVEASAGSNWMQAAYFGAKAILVLGTRQTNNVDLRAQDVTIPVNLPRFYLPPSKLSDDIRAGKVKGKVVLQAQVTWERRLAANYYAFVPGTGPAGLNALALTVPYDSSGLVPDLSSGASQAVQTAVGLALMRDFALHRGIRPVLVCFVGADGIQDLGTRNLLMALMQPPMNWRGEVARLTTQLSTAQAELRHTRQLLSNPAALDLRADRALIDRIGKIIETDLALGLDELFRQRALPPQEQDRKTMDRLTAEQVTLSRLKYAFQARPWELTGELTAPARQYMLKASQRLGGGGPYGDGLIRQLQDRREHLERRMALYGWLAKSLGLDADPARGATRTRLLQMLVSLDLSSDGTRVGPLFQGYFAHSSSISQIQDYKDWFFRQKDSPWFRAAQDVIDITPLSGAAAPQTYLAAPLAIGSEMAQAWGVPAFTLMTLDDLRLWRDTPNDTLDRLNVDNISRQLRAVRSLLWNSWNDPHFTGPSELLPEHVSVMGQVLSTSPGRPVPDLPREGFLATYYYVRDTVSRVPKPQSLPWTLGVRRCEVQECDAEGTYRFEGLPRLGPGPEPKPLGTRRIAVEVYQVMPGTGVITACTDLGQQTESIRLYVDLNSTSIDPLRSLVFNCDEFALTGLYDPRYLQNLGDVIPLDALRNAEPDRYNVLVHDRMMAGFVQPEARLYLLFRYGRVGNRLVLLNMSPTAGTHGATRGQVPTELARGFTADDLRDIRPLAMVTARDFWRLDHQRLSEYRRAGVYNDLLDSLQKDSSDQLRHADEAYRRNQGSTTVADATGAWATQARVYQATQDMANDVVRGAVFLLLLCVPFSVCMERLLVASTSIYRQIAWAGGIFAIMTAALWSFHPAFKISSSPLIVILAFAILLMSVIVIAVVYSKFDVEIKKIRSGRGQTEGASFARASVLMTAVMLGIANMRKRKFRTALTAITIVLITFAVLCFTSAATLLDTSKTPMGVTSHYAGVMLRQGGFRPLPPEALENLRTVPLWEGGTVAQRTIVQRWWNVNPTEPDEQFNVSGVAPAPARVFSARAVLGISPGESKLVYKGRVAALAEVLGAPNLERLERGERDVIYLPKTAADQLQVREGGTVKLGGLDLHVAGVFNPEEFDQKVTLLSGEPMTPVNYKSAAFDPTSRRTSDQSEEAPAANDVGSGEATANLQHLPASQIVIVPAAVSKLLPDASLRSVAVLLKDEAEVKRTTDELARRFATAVFGGYEEGVKLVSASSLTSVSGAGQVAIPLAIAGLIIFNTMMGSIAERKREIHVYTSLGLAPLHVGALFLAEALTYGLIGTVFGYVIGQGIGTALLKFGWLGGITLNYSGTSAILTMGLILLIVLLSALVPARLASRLASPSVERNWKVPPPQGDRIVAELPFTINRTAADGALAYLAEYFQSHQDGSIGKFSTADVRPFETNGNDPSRGLRAVVWLTPFDLGVRQELQLRIHPGKYPDVFEVEVGLHCLGGELRNWHRLNRPFLTDLRKQFLQWRSLTPEKMQEYIESSRHLFRERGVAPVLTAPERQ